MTEGDEATVQRILVLESEANDKGDLFCLLAQMYFRSLGYSDFRVNVATSGREIDIEGTHLAESRRVVAECKATARPEGGASINKFVGALDAERRRPGQRNIQGYFLSLSGFTASARRQEEDAGGERVVLIDGDSILETLVGSGNLASEQSAWEAAGQLVGRRLSGARPAGQGFLLASHLGWIWCLRYGLADRATHVVLVHADGSVASAVTCNSIAASDAQATRALEAYEFVPSDEPVLGSEAEARHAYLNYLRNACSTIGLEGLPVDGDIGSQRYDMADLYVPLSFVSRTRASSRSSAPGRPEHVFARPRGAGKVDLGQLLTQSRRVAVLGAPGSGKSILTKRIGFEYTSESDVHLGNESLPRLDVTPILIRCRELGETVRHTILEILIDQGKRAELVDIGGFESFVRHLILEGKLLLIVDGLDEISHPGARSSFVTQLQIFLSMHPAVRLVLTSREPGFRVVAGAVAVMCDTVGIAPLSAKSVDALCAAWHRIVFGDSPDARREGKAIAAEIRNTERVRLLGTNPLLLTSILLVHRWLGVLPRKRSVLYDRAMDVLLMTWNVEGHEPLDRDETVPQLAYLAYHMMRSGVQRIDSADLVDILAESREALPALLGFARYSPAQFVQRVEDRSSLLSLVGKEETAGRLLDVFEFKHLTFQEYLAALAIARGFVPGEDRHGGRVDLAIEPQILSAEWEEVVGLLFVLSGDRAKQLCDLVYRELGSDAGRSSEELGRGLELLASALADDAALAPADALSACTFLADNFPGAMQLSSWSSAFERILTGKFSALMESVVWGKWKATRRATNPSVVLQRSRLAGLWANVEFKVQTDRDGVASALTTLEELRGGDDSDRSRALLLVAEAARLELGVPHRARIELSHFAGWVLDRVEAETGQCLLAACVAAQALLSAGPTPNALVGERFLSALTECWGHGGGDAIGVFAGDALTLLPILGERGAISARLSPAAKTFAADCLAKTLKGRVTSRDTAAALVVAYYFDPSWKLDDLRRVARAPGLGSFAIRMRLLIGDD